MTSELNKRNYYVNKLLIFASGQVPLLSILTEIDLSLVEIEKFVNLIELSSEVDQLPSFVYHLLLLSKKGHKNIIIHKILTHMDKMHECLYREKNEKIFKNYSLNLGTVISHFTFACTQDISLGSALLSLLKEESFLGISGISFALALSKIHRFDISVVEFLKHEILECLEGKLNSFNLSGVTSDVEQNLPLVLSQITECTSIGCDDVVSGLLKLGFLLLDISTSKEVGIQVLFEIFKVRSSIFD